MIRSKKQLVLTLISVSMLTSLLSAGSGKYEMKLQFEIDNNESRQWLGGRNKSGQGSIKPTHVAIFHIRRPHVDMPSGMPGILKMLKTTAGQSLSDQQQKFMTSSDAITWWGIDTIKNHDTVFLYAVSQEDVKKMVQAYFEIHESEVKARIKEYEQYVKDKKQEIIEIKKVLPEKQKQADEVEQKYMELKKSRYFLLSDVEAYDKAEDTVLEMDKMLDLLEIDLTGIKEKIKTIEQYRSTRRLPDRLLPVEVVDKLDQMLIEQIVELKSLEAREKAAIKIHDRDKNLVDLFIQWNNLSDEVQELKANLENAEKREKEIEERLINPEPYILPPELYQDKVLIYPVLAEQS